VTFKLTDLKNSLYEDVSVNRCPTLTLTILYPVYEDTIFDFLLHFSIPWYIYRYYTLMYYHQQFRSKHYYPSCSSSNDSPSSSQSIRSSSTLSNSSYPTDQLYVSHNSLLLTLNLSEDGRHGVILRNDNSLQFTRTSSTFFNSSHSNFSSTNQLFISPNSVLCLRIYRRVIVKELI
jgi:hypothetical protein